MNSLLEEQKAIWTILQSEKKPQLFKNYLYSPEDQQKYLALELMLIVSTLQTIPI